MGLQLLRSPLSEKKWVRRRCIGRGSFGTVSLAVEQSTGAIFAVKSVNLEGSKQALQSLENEIQILKALKFPWIVSYLGESTTMEIPSGACRNLLMEYVGGGTAGDGRRDEIAARSYARCLTSALEYLHGNGIVHGDVKGKNLLLSSSWGEAKLADFGCSRRMKSSAGESQEIWRGSPLWMAPEVVNGGAATPAADVWSLGCTVIEMITGKVPWKVGEFEDPAHVLLRIGLSDELPEFPENLSSIGRDFLDKCLRRNPEERMTCEELLRHPFLCEMSPRGVLDWGNLGFDLEEEEADEEERNGFEVSVDELKAKFRDLGSSEGDSIWEDEEDWEVVRPVCSSLLQEEDTEGEETEDCEFAGAGEDDSSGEVPGEIDCCSDRREKELQETTSVPHHLKSRQHLFLLRCGEADALIGRRQSCPPLQRSPEFLSIFLFEESDSVCNRIRRFRPIMAQIRWPNYRPSYFNYLSSKTFISNFIRVMEYISNKIEYRMNWKE